MKKILFVSIVLFLLQLLVIDNYVDSLLTKSLWKVNFKSESQRRVFQLIENIKTNTSRNVIYAIGGSSVREFFMSDNLISKRIGHSFVNCGTSSQSPFDSLKLVSLMRPNQKAFYMLNMKSLYDYDVDFPTDSHYSVGAKLMYPIWLEEKLVGDIIDKNKVDFSYKIMPKLNPYIYLSKLYIKNTIRDNKSFFQPNNETPKQYRYINKTSLSQYKLNLKMNEFIQKIETNKIKNIKLNFLIIERMIELSRNNKVSFYLVEQPFNPIFNKYFTKEDFDLYNTLLNNLQQKHDNVVLVRNNFFTKSDVAYYHDSIHLNDNGKKNYYEQTIKLLKKLADD